MKTVNDGWISYRDLCVPENAGEVQRKVTKESFYAGAGWLLSLLSSDEITDSPEEDGVQYVQSMHEEIQRFMNENKAIVK